MANKKDEQIGGTGTAIVIFDIKTGAWEINQVRLNLEHEYTPGLTTILPIKHIEEYADGKKIFDGDGKRPMVAGVMLEAQPWYGYILFGLKMLWWKIRPFYIERR